MNEKEIIERVHALYPDSVVEVAGENCNFELSVITPRFEGVSLVRRQQPILALFQDELASGRLHALHVNARTPEEARAQAGLVQLA